LEPQAKTVLLTGASGFLGSHLLKSLLSRGYQVIVLKRSKSNCWRIEEELKCCNFVDVDLEPLRVVFEQQKIDAVVHVACHYGRDSQSVLEVLKSNVLLGVELLELAIEFKVKAFFNSDSFFNTASSSQKYLNHYTLSKKQFVEWLKVKCDEIAIVNLKIAHMYGLLDESSKFVPWLFQQFVDKVDCLPMTEGRQERDFINVKDVVSAFLFMLGQVEQLDGFEEHQVGSGELTSLKDFVILCKTGYESRYGEAKTKLDFGALDYREGEMMTVESDISSLEQKGWTPSISLEKGVMEMVSFGVPFKSLGNE
jgi:nucleoside-diphosphate-sugar epimerase